MKKKCVIAAAIFFMISASALLFNKNEGGVSDIQLGTDMYASAQTFAGDPIFKAGRLRAILKNLAGLRPGKLNRAEILAGAQDYIAADVDFDGTEDILVFNGYGRNPGITVYSCYLNRDGAYEYCDSFETIPNPAIDKQNRVVLSNTVNAASSHQWAKYAFVDNQFVMTERLTAYMQYSSSHAVWKYNLEALAGSVVEGLKLVRIVDTSKVADLEYADAHIYDENSGWAIDSDRWKPLYSVAQD